MRVLVSGDRNWANYDAVENAFSEVEKQYGSNIELMHGNCYGLDMMASAEAHLRKWKVFSRPADWSKYGKRAGPIRNGAMLTEHQPELLIVFHDDIENSKGTKNMLTQARSRQRSAGYPNHIWKVTSLSIEKD